MFSKGQRTGGARRPGWISISVVVGMLSTLIVLAGPDLESAPAGAAEIVSYRVNAGGSSVTGTPSWSADTKTAPSPYVNAAETGNYTYAGTTAVDTSHPSVPAGTPAQLFQTERYDLSAAPQLQWNFPAPAGKRYEVRLFFAEIFAGTSAVGARMFDVVVDGNVVLDKYDTFAKVGANKGIVERVQVTSDGNIDIDFVHVANNPAIKAIEIIELPASSPGQLGASPSTVGFGKLLVNTTANQSLALTNLGTNGNPSITITGTSITGTSAAQFSDSFADGTGVTVTPGATHSVTVSFKPTSTGIKGATLNVSHTGSNSPLTVPLTGEGVSSVPISFSKGTLAGETSGQPTSLQFGPDNRLYVVQQNGLIKIYDVVRNSKDNYAVTATESITSIMSIPNRNDDGTLNPNVKNRQVTGLLVVGTAANPVIYVGSSDPRIGGGSTGEETGLDTNSGIISRLTWNGSSWQKLDLVRGLPRSEENHAINGMQLNKATNTLYVTQGGNTNMGAPSNNFAKLPEYALSTAILTVNLNAIGNTTYDLPTLDDSDRPGTVDANDPFGGNNGKNQAKLVPGGPVQVHHAGLRNPYDVVITESGRIYTIDNGGNAGWGDIPVDEGPQGTCTNGIKEPGKTDPDTLHLVESGGYGGHPNPTRGNMANKFSSPLQSPVSAARPIECDYQAPGAERGSLTSFPASTNGLTEYTTTNFGGQMKGDLLAASFDNKIHRIKLNSTGTAIVSSQALFQTVGATPLDVVAQGSGQVFPGTVWVADIGNGNITVFEPGDYGGGGGGGGCTGTNSTTLDEDGDGFKNADEIANGTNPCSSADVPPDWDGDKVSDLNDPDDDNDGLPDTSDPFAIDANNGTTTTTPLRLTWDNDAPAAGGLMGLGFTGLMTNGVSDYQQLFDPLKMTAGGAAGVTTVDQVSEGDAYATANSQQYGFQVGFVPPSGTFTAHTRILAPFAGTTPQNYQSMGLFIGTGHQDHYAKLVVSANGGTGGIQFLKEVNGTPVARPPAAVTLPGPSAIDLYLTINRAANTVQPSFAVTNGTTMGPRTNVGGPEPIPASWHNGPAAMAAGIISTSAGPAPAFAATWDFLEVVPEAAPAKALAASPTSVALTGTQSGASQSANVAISSTDGSAASTTATDSASWLSVSPSTGTTPRTLSVTANPSGLASGTHNGTVTVTATGYTSVQIPVSFTVNPEVARGLQANPTTLNLSTPEGSTTSANVSLSATDGSAAAFTVSDNAQWLSVSPTTGTTPKAVAVTANATGLAPGTYNATVTAQASGYSSVQIPVKLTVNATTFWSTLPPMPVPLGEVSSGIIGEKLYVVGQGSNVTLAYDLKAKNWSSAGLAVRPFVGNHHGAEVVNGKLYLFGGLGGSSEGKVQIYDPASNTWTVGAAMPFAAGSSSTAVIGSYVYVAGGITGTTTTNQAARYNPANNTWQAIAPMPQGRNHAAAESDGSKMFVFGGRGPGSGDGNVVANGFDTVQVYNAANNTWVSSLTTGSTLKPLPQGRGGMGTAGYYKGEFYVIGGETKTGAGANASGVYGRVDIYKPSTNTWRVGPNMPTARHGIFPVLDGNVIHVPGGGVQAGFSASAVHEVLTAPK